MVGDTIIIQTATRTTDFACNFVISDLLPLTLIVAKVLLRFDKFCIICIMFIVTCQVIFVVKRKVSFSN